MFDSAKAKIGKKLPVEDDSIFEKIVEVSKNLKKYNLTPDRMGCTDGGVQIYFEIVQVSLGNGNYEEKLRQVEPILKKLTELYPGKAGVFAFRELRCRIGVDSVCSGGIAAADHL